MIDGSLERPCRHLIHCNLTSFFLSLTVEALQGKTCQDSQLSGGVGQFESRFQGEWVVPVEYFFGFYKTRHILLSNGANCIGSNAVVLTQYRRVEDGRTDRQTDRRTELP